jgi:membrane-associated phospholipid phosphatase
MRGRADALPTFVVRRPVVDRRARLTASVVVLFGLLFVGLGLALRQSEGTAVDLTATRAVQGIDHQLVVGLMVGISSLGYLPWSWLALGCAVTVLLVCGLYREVPFVIATEGAGMMVASIKLLVERPRPGAETVRVMSELLDYSYPSGHVVSYVSLYGFLFFLVYVLVERSWQRTAVLSVLALLVGLVGVSRIYLGHHWASDVVGGYALGTAYLLVLIEAYRLLAIRPGSIEYATTSLPLMRGAIRDGH